MTNHPRIARCAALVLLAGGLFLASARLAAQEQTPPSAPAYAVSSAASAIRIDGELNEEAWKQAVVIDLPFEWTPGDNIPAPVRTECLLTYDKHRLYIAFRCHDPEPGKIRAHLMDRDAIDTFIQDDHISFMLDAANDERRAFQFRINPLGVQADAVMSEVAGGSEDFSWDAIWNAAGRIESWGYVVEAAIPFSQLRFPAADGPRTWGFSAERSWPRTARHRITSHVRSRSSACVICQFNKITGLAGITPGRSLEFTPALTARRSDNRDMAAFPEGGMRNGTIKLEPGLTAKWGITPNLIFNAAVNPDFSQVEADVQQLDVNNRFALYYAEKRPFFLEGADYFETPVQAVFTRTLFDPAWGAKLTGKVGRTALGIIAAQDETTNLLFPANGGSMSAVLSQHAYSGVLRLRRDVGRHSAIGALYTGRMGDEYANHVAGVDAFWRPDARNFVSFQFLHSQTEYPAALADEYGQKQGRFGGNAVDVNYNYNDRDWGWTVAARDYGKDFRADLGFVPRVDMRSVTAMVSRFFWGRPGGWFNQIRPAVMVQYVEDHDRNATDKSLIVGLRYMGPWELLVNVHGNFLQERVEGRDFRYSNFDFTVSGKPRGGMYLILFGSMGGAVDYANLRSATQTTLQPQMEIGLGRHLNLNLSHEFRRLQDGGRRILTANLSQARLIYNFNVRTFIRAIVQYRDVHYNPAMYLSPMPEKSRHLFTQFLFSYKLNPQTVLFLGYSDTSLGSELYDLTRASRTFFFKVAYAIQR